MDVKLTLTIAKEYAEQIRDGQKEFEARYLKDTGAKLGSLVRGDKFHWFRRQRLAATISDVMVFPSIPAMLEKVPPSKLLPGFEAADAQGACVPCQYFRFKLCFQKCF